MRRAVAVARRFLWVVFYVPFCSAIASSWYSRKAGPARAKLSVEGFSNGA